MKYTFFKKPECILKFTILFTTIQQKLLKVCSYDSYLWYWIISTGVYAFSTALYLMVVSFFSGGAVVQFFFAEIR